MGVWGGKGGRKTEGEAGHRGEGGRGKGVRGRGGKRAKGEEGKEATWPRTYMLHEKWASGIEHKLVGIEHLPTVCLKLNVAQVWVIDHGTEVGHQQTKGELKREGGEWPLPPWPPNHAGAQRTGRRRPVRTSCCSPQGLTSGSTLKSPSGPQTGSSKNQSFPKFPVTPNSQPRREAWPVDTEARRMDRHGRWPHGTRWWHQQLLGFCEEATSPAGCDRWDLSPSSCGVGWKESISLL